MCKALILLAVLVTISSVADADDCRLLDSYRDLGLYYAIEDICVADFDNNGSMDVAVLTQNYSRIYVFWGHAHGRFTPGPQVMLGSEYSDYGYVIHADDVDGDNNDDLIVANHLEYDNVISIVFGNGDGTFNETPVTYDCYNNGTDIVTFDADGDTDIDIIVATSSYIMMYVNDGTGAFDTRIDYPCGNSWNYGLDMADFNGDSYIDLVTSNYNYDTLRVLLNDGAGQFNSITSLACGDAYDVIAAKINNDDHYDVISANRDDRITIFMGNGDGTFGDSVVYAVGDDNLTLCASDVDQDGDNDLIVTGRLSKTVSVMENIAGESFAAPVDYFAEDPYAVTTDDVDDNGFPDIVAVNNYGGGKVMIMYNDGTGSYPTPVKYSQTKNTYSHGIVTADLDGDADPDFVTANTSSDDITVFVNNGDSTLSLNNNWPIGSGAYDIVAADLDNNGTIDIVTADHDADSISVQLNTGTGGFYYPQTQYAAGDGPYQLTAAHFNGDAYIDLAVSNDYSGDVSVYINDGDGTFAEAVSYPISSSLHGIAADDFDDDGDIDLIMTNYGTSYSLPMLLNDGSGVFTSGTDVPISYYAESILPIDFTNDGISDLVVFHDSYALFWYVNNGDGTFQEPDTAAMPHGGSHIFAEDFNLDGYTDFCISHYWDAELCVHLNLGNGSFMDPMCFEVGFDSRAACAADIDSDGDPDIVAATTDYYDTDYVVILWNRSELVPVSVDEEDNNLLPDDFVLFQNYPNPFNPATTIEYTLPSRSHVEIAIYNILGQRVTTLAETDKPAGRYSVTWDGCDDSGKRQASGIYFYQIRTDNKTESKKMLLLK